MSGLSIKNAIQWNPLRWALVCVQIGLWAHGISNVTNVHVSFSDLVPIAGSGDNISSTAFNCFNLGGTVCISTWVRDFAERIHRYIAQ